jgi:hypothetical protein
MENVVVADNRSRVCNKNNKGWERGATKADKTAGISASPSLGLCDQGSNVLTYDLPGIVMGYGRNRAFSIRFEIILSRRGGRNSSIRHRITSIFPRATAVFERCESAGVTSVERHAGGKQAGLGFREPS